MMLRRGAQPPAAAATAASEPAAASPTGGDEQSGLDVQSGIDEISGIDVQCSDEQGDVAVDAAGLAALLAAALAGEGVEGPAEVSLTFVGEQRMAALNAEHLDEAGPTDVLSFPLYDPDEDLPPGMVALLGDIVVCPAVASRYAAANGRSVEHELALLVVHGALHLLGHDHAEPEEAAVMVGRELHHLRAHVDPDFAR